MGSTQRGWFNSADILIEHPFNLSVRLGGAVGGFRICFCALVTEKDSSSRSAVRSAGPIIMLGETQQPRHNRLFSFHRHDCHSGLTVRLDRVFDVFCVGHHDRSAE